MVDIYQATKRRGKYPTLATDTEVIVVLVYTPQKINLDDFFTYHGYKTGYHFFPSCLEVSSTGYSEFDEPISACV